MRRRLPRIRTGINSLDGALAKWADAIEYAAGITAVPPLSLTESAGGPIIRINEPLTIYARLNANSGGGIYTFTEVYPASGWWAVTPSGRTGSCREFNGNASLSMTPAKYVLLRWFGEVSEWRFQSGTC
jgi:hypothetical protein